MNRKHLTRVFSHLLQEVRHWQWRTITLCFLTAFTFWVFHSLNAEHTTTIEIPLRITFDHGNLVPIQEPPSEISAHVTGYGWNLLRKSFGMGLLPVEIRLDNPLHTRVLTSAGMLPFLVEKYKDLKVNHILQDSIFFEFDTLQTKEVVLVVDSIQLRLRENHKVVSPVRLHPSVVMVDGPASVLRRYPDTIAVTLEEEYIDKDFSENVLIPYPEYPLVRPRTNRTEVKFDVNIFVKKTLQAKLRLLNFPANRSIEPPDAYIDFLIDSEEENLDFDSITVVLNYKNLAPGDTMIRAEIVAPRRFHDFNVYPPNFRVKRR